MTQDTDEKFMRHALALAKRGYGKTSPNPMVGAVLVKRGQIIGTGYHRSAGMPHAEVEAIRNAMKRGNRISGATLYVTLEPCSTEGRTPPCTKAILECGIQEVVVAAKDPNPLHAGRAFLIMKRKGIRVRHGILAEAAARLNEAFNHWIVHRTPFVTIKAAMTLDGKIAASDGRSKWITGEKARAFGMKLRRGSDAILVGVNTVLADDPSLTVRSTNGRPMKTSRLKRFVLDTRGRVPKNAILVTDEFAGLTTIVTGRNHSGGGADQWPEIGDVWQLSSRDGKIDLKKLLKRMGEDGITSLLVEGGGEVNASFIENRLAHRIAFFYAPKVLGGRESRTAVAGRGARNWSEIQRLEDIEWRKLGDDLLLTARICRTVP